MTVVDAVETFSTMAFIIGMTGSFWFAAQVRKDPSAARIPLLTLVASPLRKEIALLEPQAQRSHAWLVRCWLFWFLSAVAGIFAPMVAEAASSLT